MTLFDNQIEPVVYRSMRSKNVTKARRSASHFLGLLYAIIKFLSNRFVPFCSF